MTDLTKDKRADVTREHRVAAWRALDHDQRTELPHPGSEMSAWLDGKASDVFNLFMLADARVAQAIADAEARGAATRAPSAELEALLVDIAEVRTVAVGVLRQDNLNALAESIECRIDRIESALRGNL